uniref:Uncharacterized protein n=1 Tax=Desulfatirhabdium butyrativorans TaxID=340467 RepID=A0A7C4RST9_9BACT
MTRTVRLSIIAGTCIVAVAIAVLLVKFPQNVPNETTDPVPESFTFFDLGANSRFTKAIREDLRERLGSDAISYRGITDLAFFDASVMQVHFPTILDRHRALNTPPGERVEHDIVKLTYRYAWKRESPFKLIDLVFSNVNGLPLYFVIGMTREGSDIIAALVEKYGEPQRFPGAQERQIIRCWEKNGDMLIVSEKPDRFGNPEYQVYIVFVNSIDQLIAHEREQAKRKEEKIRKAADKAF